MNDITIIGSANLDTTRYVDRLPDDIENRVEMKGEVKTSPGGKGANQALALRKQLDENDDIILHFLGCIGKDQNGLDIGTNLKNGGIDISRIKLVNKNTDGRLVFVGTKGKDKGKNMMVGYGECINEITKEYLEQNIDILEKSDILMIQLKMPEESIKYVIEYASKHGKKIIVDPCPEKKIEFLIKEGLLDKATYLTPNSDEAWTIKKLKEGYSFDEIKEALKTGIDKEKKINDIKELLKEQPNVIATIGKEGALYVDENKEVKHKDTFNDIPVDTTGAGDTFNGAFVAAIYRNETIGDAIEKGLAASSAKVLYEGAQNGVPTLKETIEKIKRERNVEDKSI